MSKLDELIQQYCPDGVEYVPLGKIATISRGGNFQKKDYVENGVPCIHYGQIYTQFGLFVEEPLTYISAEKAAKQKFAEKNDIVIAVTSENIEDVCKCVAWLGDEKIAVSGHAAIIHHNQDPKYLTYYFHTAMFAESKRKLAHGTKVIEVTPDRLNEVLIPLPALPVQREIVRILDGFTMYSAELAAELAARKEQYETYREKLLTFNNENPLTHLVQNCCAKGVIFKKLGDISEFRRGSFPQPYGNKEWYDGEGAMPFVQVADISENMILVENTKRKISKLAQPMSVFAKKGSIIISLQGTIGRIAITQYDAYIDRTVAIFQNLSEGIDRNYFVYQLQNIFSIKEKTARGSTIKTITKEEFTNFEIPVPPLNVQREIVRILDNFHNITSDIYSGLPAEIEARQKQYEYYRDKLLTFRRV